MARGQGDKRQGKKRDAEGKFKESGPSKAKLAARTSPGLRAALRVRSYRTMPVQQCLCVCSQAKGGPELPELNECREHQKILLKTPEALCNHLLAVRSAFPQSMLPPDTRACRCTLQRSGLPSSFRLRRYAPPCVWRFARCCALSLGPGRVSSVILVLKDW